MCSFPEPVKFFLEVGTINNRSASLLFMFELKLVLKAAAGYSVLLGKRYLCTLWKDAETH